MGPGVERREREREWSEAEQGGGITIGDGTGKRWRVEVGGRDLPQGLLGVEMVMGRGEEMEDRCVWSTEV